MCLFTGQGDEILCCHFDCSLCLNFFLYHLDFFLLQAPELPFGQALPLSLADCKLRIESKCFDLHMRIASNFPRALQPETFSLDGFLFVVLRPKRQSSSFISATENGMFPNWMVLQPSFFCQYILVFCGFKHYTYHTFIISGVKIICVHACMPTLRKSTSDACTVVFASGTFSFSGSV